MVRGGKATGSLTRVPLSLDCRNNIYVTSRYIADSGDSVYYVDNERNFIRHLWHDILNDKFDAYSIVAKQIIDFALDGNKPAILFASSLTLATGSTIDLKAKVQLAITSSLRRPRSIGRR